MDINKANIFTYRGTEGSIHNTRWDVYIEILDYESESEKSTSRLATDGINYIERNVVLYNVKEDKIIPFNKYDIEGLNGWLFKEGYGYLNINDRNYFGMFIKKHDIWYKGAENGSIELIFRLKPYKYSNIRCHGFGVNNSTYTNTMEVKGDVNSQFYPEEVYIENNSREALNINIENKSISNNKLTFNNLISMDKVFIDGAEDYMISKADKEEDLYSKCNRNYIKLNQGNNIIEVTGSKRAKIFINYREIYKLKEGDLFWERK